MFQGVRVPSGTPSGTPRSAVTASGHSQGLSQSRSGDMALPENAGAAIWQVPTLAADWLCWWPSTPAEVFGCYRAGGQSDQLASGHARTTTLRARPVDEWLVVKVTIGPASWPGWPVRIAPPEVHPIHATPQVKAVVDASSTGFCCRGSFLGCCEGGGVVSNGPPGLLGSVRRPDTAGCASLSSSCTHSAYAAPPYASTARPRARAVHQVGYSGVRCARP